jgi:urease gamma subunit
MPGIASPALAVLAAFASFSFARELSYRTLHWKSGWFRVRVLRVVVRRRGFREVRRKVNLGRRSQWKSIQNADATNVRRRSVIATSTARFNCDGVRLTAFEVTHMTSASDMERARTAMMVAAGVVTSTGLLVLTQRSIRSSIAGMLKVRRIFEKMRE